MKHYWFSLREMVKVLVSVEKHLGFFLSLAGNEEEQKAQEYPKHKRKQNIVSLICRTLTSSLSALVHNGILTGHSQRIDLQHTHNWMPIEEFFLFIFFFINNSERKKKLSWWGLWCFSLWREAWLFWSIFFPESQWIKSEFKGISSTLDYLLFSIRQLNNI